MIAEASADYVRWIVTAEDPAAERTLEGAPTGATAPSAGTDEVTRHQISSITCPTGPFDAGERPEPRGDPDRELYAPIPGSSGNGTSARDRERSVVGDP